MTRRLLRHHASQIRNRRLGVQTGEHVIAAWVSGELVHPRVPVVEIAEHDRFRRTGLLAGGHDIAVAHVATLEARLILPPANAPHAETSFLHTALRPHPPT